MAIVRPHYTTHRFSLKWRGLSGRSFTAKDLAAGGSAGGIVRGVGGLGLYRREPAERRSTASSRAFVEEGAAVIHGRYAYGAGSLSRSFRPVIPGIFILHYRLSGTCSDFIAELRLEGETRITFDAWNYGWFEGRLKTPAGMWILDGRERVLFRSGEEYTKGSLRLDYDGTAVRILHGGRQIVSVRRPAMIQGVPPEKWVLQLSGPASAS